MGRPKRLEGGTRNSGLAIEYVRTRKVLRLVGWMAETPIAPVDIPLDELCPGLGISPHDLGAPHHYMLFAGSHRQPAGGLRDLVGTFDNEDDAWAAFRELRLAHPSTQGWAELATIDWSGHIHQLAWFGLHQAGSGDDAPAEKSPPVLRRPLVRRRVRAEETAAYLRAVMPS